MRSSQFYWILLPLLVAFDPAGAQENRSATPESVALRNDCRLARQVLVHGEPANKREWALGIMQDCGTDGADAVAHQLLANRHVDDRTPLLDALAEAATMVLDERIYEAAREVATDAAAGDAARVYALSIWLTQLNGGHVRPYEALVNDPAAGGRIILGDVVSEGPPTLRPVPEGELVSSVAVLNALVASDASPCVRIAARQVRSAFELMLEKPEL